MNVGRLSCATHLVGVAISRAMLVRLGVLRVRRRLERHGLTNEKNTRNRRCVTIFALQLAEPSLRYGLVSSFFLPKLTLLY